MRLDELESPALTVDLDAVERNIAGMQSYCDEHGIALRPHIKTHKLPQVARLQVDAGAPGSRARSSARRRCSQMRASTTS